MTNIQIFNQVIYLFTAIGFLYHIINKRIMKNQRQRTYQSKKVTITPERAKRINQKRARRNKPKQEGNYIEACWDEVNKI